MSGYIGAQPVPQTTQTRQSFTATDGQTSFATLGYQVDYLSVYLNGVKLNSADFTATNGSDIVLGSGCAVDDILEMVAFSTFTVADQTFTGTTTVNTLAVTSTVDGRDVSVDGTKLDGIEASATADQTDAEIKTAVEAGSDIALGGNPTTTTQSAGNNTTRIATTAYADTAVANLVASAPASLNTLNELAAALGDDASFSTTVTNSIATKLPLSGGTLTGNLGIGTSSPLSKLNVKGTQGNWRVDPDSVSNEIQVLSTTAANDGFRDFRLRTQTTIFETAGSERMRINSSGNVGLGTTSIESWRLAVAGTNFSSGGGLAVAAFRDLTSYNTSNNGAGITLQGVYNSGGGYTNFATIQAGKLNNTDGDYSTYLRFSTRYNGASQVEAMRIDNSGNLLVGKTVLAFNTVGVAMQPAGVLAVTRDGATPFIVNRKSSSGELTQFQKDGAAVGSISVRSDDYLNVQIGSLGTGITGTSSHTILPSVNNVRSNNTNDLGNSTYRWKDLYLSGGVNFGAISGQSGRSIISPNNTLSDYEFGGWTPTISGGTLSVNRALYVRIGNQVTIQAYISSIVPPNNSSSFQIYGLPFTTASFTNDYAAIPISYWGAMDLNGVSSFITGHNSSNYIYLHTSAHSGSAITNAQIIASGATSERSFIFSGTYITNQG